MIVGKEDLSKLLDKVADQKTAQKALKQACAYVELKAKEKAPVGETHQLRDSIISKVDGLVGEVGTNLEYAVYVHQGTGMFAKDGNGRQGYWVFVTGESADSSQSSGNRTIYTLGQAIGIKNYLVNVKGIPEKDVWITQGQHPNPFLEQAFDESKPMIRQIFQSVIKEATDDRL